MCTFEIEILIPSPEINNGTYISHHAAITSTGDEGQGDKDTSVSESGRRCRGDVVRISGYVSKAGAGVGRSDNDRQFLFCNGRPVDLPKLTRTMNEVVFY
jgi:hypothetical protein